MEEPNFGRTKHDPEFVMLDWDELAGKLPAKKKSPKQCKGRGCTTILSEHNMKKNKDGLCHTCRERKEGKRQ